VSGCASAVHVRVSCVWYVVVKGQGAKASKEREMAATFGDEASFAVLRARCVHFLFFSFFLFFH